MSTQHFTDADERAALIEGADALDYRVEKAGHYAEYLTDADRAMARAWKQFAAVLREMADCYEVSDAA